MIQLGYYPLCMALGMVMISAWILLGREDPPISRVIAAGALVFFALAAAIILGELPPITA